MQFKIFCNQFQEYVSFEHNPNTVLKQYIDKVTQLYQCIDAAMPIVVINGNKVNSNLTLEELEIGLDCQINLFFQYFEDIQFCLKDDVKQTKKINLNIYQSIQRVELLLAKQLRIDYEVEIIQQEQNLPKNKSFSLLKKNEYHLFQIKANLFIEINNQQMLLNFYVFDRILFIKQIIRKLFNIKGCFQIFYNDHIQLDQQENLNETIFSLQIQNNSILKINVQQYITINCKFNNFNGSYKVQINQNLEAVINQLKKNHKFDVNSITEIKCNGQLIPIENLEKEKQFIMEQIIEVKEEKVPDQILITIIDYFNLTRRKFRSFNEKQKLLELLNAIGKKDDIQNYEFICNGKNIEINSYTFNQAGFVQNQNYFVYYKFINKDLLNQSLKLKQQQVQDSQILFMIQIEVKLNQILKIIAQSQLKSKLNLDQISFYLGNRKLDSNKTFQELNIMNNDEIEIIQNKNTPLYNSGYFSEKSLISESQKYKSDSFFISQNNINEIESGKMQIRFCKNQGEELNLYVDENDIISQIQIYKDIQAQQEIILKFKGVLIDVNKSFKELGIIDRSSIDVIYISDNQIKTIQKKEKYQNKKDENIIQMTQYDVNKRIYFQFWKDGILRKECKTYNQETIRFQLIKQALISEYQLLNNLNIMYQGQNVDLNSNISRIVKENDCLFTLEEQQKIDKQKQITLQIVLPDGDENWEIQIDQDDEISSIYNKVYAKLEQNNFTLFYDGKVLESNNKPFRELQAIGEYQVEVIL
ncbi:unnamed protein product [Paramecium sonneborni]|uniref:Ubiquitin-like domain-containing protein n=1 Tax=Paramecium sonneborni TaxID=65129 RepID=A0A8S1R0M7_9CILI|nr:unnamed protein product [Paramecium sonneborni]